MVTAALSPAGERAPVKAGDFILTRGDSWVSRLIRFGERLRVWRGFFRFPWQPALTVEQRAERLAWYASCQFNHAALVVDDKGGIVEALSRGLTAGNVSKYDPSDYVVVSPGFGVVQRRQGLAWAAAEFERHDRYGWAQIAGIVVQLLTGTKVDFSYDGTLICSAYVARYLEHAGYQLSSLSPFNTLPSELAVMFDAHLARA